MDGYDCVGWNPVTYRSSKRGRFQRCLGVGFSYEWSHCRQNQRESIKKKKKLMENAPKLETRPETNGNGTELVSSLCKFQRFNLNKTTERNGSLDVRFDISKPKMDEWSIQFHVLVRNSNQTVWFGKFFDLKWRQIALKLSASIRFRQLRRNGQLRTFEISFREFNSIEIQQTNLKLNRICGNWSKMNF